MAEGAVNSESVYKTLTLASGQESGASGESVQEVGGSELPPGRISSTITPLPLLHAQHIPHVGSLWGLIFFLCPEVWLLVVPMPVCPGPLWQAKLDFNNIRGVSSGFKPSQCAQMRGQ